MIKINNKPFRVENFPDGTQKLKIQNLKTDDLKTDDLETDDLETDDLETDDLKVEITWKYESEAELFTVLALADRFKENGKKVSLKMPYIPNARMDRVKSDEEVFTLKTFCKLINQAGFEKVTVLDPHSNVSLALIDRVKQMNIQDIIKRAAINKLPKDIILYFPDEGSQKRYADLFPEYRCVWGMKKRDWETGEIKGLDVVTNGIDLKGKMVLMIDDIIAFGGSLYYSALKLKELGADKIYAYATHTENSIMDETYGKLKKLLENGTVTKLFTTDSIFTENNEKIDVMEV